MAAPTSPRVRSFVGRQSFRGQFATDYADRTLAREFRASMDDVLGNLNNWIRHMEGASADIAVEALRPTFDKSQMYCPVDGGDLKASGYLESRLFRGHAVAEIGYGKGGNPDYAIYVHERTDLKHKAPSRSKFLQDAVEEDLSAIQGRIKDAVIRASGTGGS
jgi:hypothetical protein